MGRSAAVKPSSPSKTPPKRRRESAPEKTSEKTATVVRTANLSIPSDEAEAEAVVDQATVVSELGKKIQQHFQGKKSLGPKDIRDRLQKFLSDEQVEENYLVAYLKAIEAEAGDDSGVAARNPFRKNLIEVIKNMVVSIIVCYSFCYSSNLT